MHAGAIPDRNLDAGDVLEPPYRSRQPFWELTKIGRSLSWTASRAPDPEPQTPFYLPSFLARYLHMYKCYKRPAIPAHTLLPSLVDPTKQPRLPIQPLTHASALEPSTSTTNIPINISAPLQVLIVPTPHQPPTFENQPNVPGENFFKILVPPPTPDLGPKS